MNASERRWNEDKDKYGWVMPAASWWKRLPLIRHVRYVYHGVQVYRHYRFVLGQLGFPTGYDAWVLYGIAHGEERPRG